MTCKALLTRVLALVAIVWFTSVAVGAPVKGVNQTQIQRVSADAPGQGLKAATEISAFSQEKTVKQEGFETKLEQSNTDAKVVESYVKTVCVVERRTARSCSGNEIEPPPDVKCEGTGCVSNSAIGNRKPPQFTCEGPGCSATLTGTDDTPPKVRCEGTACQPDSGSGTDTPSGFSCDGRDCTITTGGEHYPKITCEGPGCSVDPTGTDDTPGDISCVNGKTCEIETGGTDLKQCQETDCKPVNFDCDDSGSCTLGIGTERETASQLKCEGAGCSLELDGEEGLQSKLQCESSDCTVEGSSDGESSPPLECQGSKCSFQGPDTLQRKQAVREAKARTIDAILQETILEATEETEPETVESATNGTAIADKVTAVSTENQSKRLAFVTPSTASPSKSESIVQIDSDGGVEETTTVSIPSEDGGIKIEARGNRIFVSAAADTGEKKYYGSIRIKEGAFSDLNPSKFRGKTPLQALGAACGKLTTDEWERAKKQFSTLLQREYGFSEKQIEQANKEQVCRALAAGRGGQGGGGGIGGGNVGLGGREVQTG